MRIRIIERTATLCTFFIFLPFLTSLHLFTTARYYFALILQYGVARCLFQRFFAETQFWSFWAKIKSFNFKNSEKNLQLIVSGKLSRIVKKFFAEFPKKFTVILENLRKCLRYFERKFRKITKLPTKLCETFRKWHCDLNLYKVRYPRFTCEWSRKNLWFYILSLNGE